MKTYLWFLLTALWLLSCAAVAESPGPEAGNGGTLRPYGLPLGKRSPVRMEREEITISFYRLMIYDARIDYRFHNEGPAAVISLALPENDYAVKPGRIGLNRLTIWADGRRIRATRKIITHAPVFPGPNAEWIFSLPFRHGQSRVIQVRFRSCVWGGCATGLNYQFANGVWSGPAPARRLTIVDTDHTAQEDYQIDAGVPLRRNGSRFSYQWPKDAPPEELEVTTM